jgi:hypothetical protein
MWASEHAQLRRPRRRRRPRRLVGEAIRRPCPISRTPARASCRWST